MSSSGRIEPLYVVDTHALVWYLKSDKRLSDNAKAIFLRAEQGETQIVISAITIAEMFFINSKHQFFEDFAAMFNDLQSRSYFQLVSFEAQDVLDFTADSAAPEMYDRIITGLARRLNAPLITVDSQITDAGVAQIIW